MTQTKKILVIDNYDSFTYNLVHLIQEITAIYPDVVRNDEIAMDAINEYDKIILSPGPGIPIEAGSLLSIIKDFAPFKSILGVCLGHQAIAEVFGGILVNTTDVAHGIATDITVDNQTSIFKTLPRTITVGRYHSWIVSKENFPDSLSVIAHDDEDHIMALKHKQYQVYGIQFHPESVLTPQGKIIVQNWLDS